MLPREAASGSLPAKFLPEAGDIRPWSAYTFIQSGTALTFLIIVLAALMITFHPSLRVIRQWYDSSDQLFYKAGRILLICVAYMISGPSLMVLNKEILQTLGFDFPLTLSGLGLSTTAIFIHLLVASGVAEVRSETRGAVSGNIWYWSVLPIAVAKSATLACGNAVYLHLGLGFIQMLKAFNPVIVVIVMQLCGLALPPRVARWGVYLIIAGTLVEVKGEMNITLLGATLMMTSEVMEAVNLVLTQKLLHNCKFSLVEGLYFIAPPSSAFLFSAAAVMEWPRLVQDSSYSIIVEHPAYFAGSCLLGLAVNFIGMAVVQATSSLTVKVLNTIRGVGVVLVGILFYGELCTYLELAGYTAAIAGFMLYNIGQYTLDKTEQRE
jgi:hypothetical protein